MTHLIFYKRGHPFFAIPVNASLKVSLSSIRCLPSFTTKRKLFKIFVFFITAIYYYLNKLLRFRNSSSEFAELSNWCERFLEKSKITDYSHVIIWSLVPNRERFYVHYLDKAGDPIWFAKLTSNKSDAKLLNNEYEQIRRIRTSQKVQIFSTPEVIDCCDDENYSYIVLDYLANTDRLFHPSKNELPMHLLDAIRSDIEIKTLENVLSLDWWQNFILDKENFAELGEYVKNSSRHSMVKISFIHGDFGSENILLNSNGRFKVKDWERSHSQGPFYVDELAFWLGQNHRMLKGGSQKVVDTFYSTFKHIPRLDLALALCFLVGARFDLAIVVSKNWKNTDENTIG